MRTGTIFYDENLAEGPCDIIVRAYAGAST